MNNLSLSRWASLGIATIYLVQTVTDRGFVSGLMTVLYCFIPLACIWFPEALGDYTGFFLFDGITRESPPSWVFFFGWVVLLLPVAIAAFFWFEGIDLRTAFQ
jgi:hypothetical protein